MSRQRFYGGLMAGYVVVLALVTLVPRPGSPGTSLDLLPFHQTWQLLSESRDQGDAITPTVGNIALFVPFGWLLPMTWPWARSLKRILVVSMTCSATIEVCQFLFITGRAPTIDDVIFNALGSAVGAVMFFAPRAA
jgi:glycopeptide antibiotics resistance protein